MTKISRSALVPYSADQMFQLVNDVEAYPSFMSGCLAAKLISKTDNSLQAELTLGKSGVKQTFTTRNELQPPERMIMRLVDGPFKHFEGHWQFQPLDESSCKVMLDLEFSFANKLLGLTVGKWFEQIASEQVDAICQRAQQVYGT